MLIVIALIAGIVSIAIPRIKKTNTNIKSIVRQLSVLSKEVHSYAQLKNATYRIAFRMGDKEGDAYFVEASNREVLVMSQAKQKKIDSLSAKEKPASPFQPAGKPMKGEKLLPTGLKFKSVETQGIEKPVTTGMAYIHYSPEGMVEKSIVQITDGKDLTWSLIFNPITGHADIVNKAMTLKDLESL
jgi:general secretion pathway protein H